MKRIAIIGGGLSGLSAAYELARNEPQIVFRLFEASPRLGGIVETIREDGFVIECGPDSWVTEKPWARELAVELGLEAEIIPSNDNHRRTYLLQQGRLVAMPDSMRMMVPTNLDAIAESPFFSEEARLTYRREPERAAELRASALKDDEDESIASFVRRHFGDEVVRTIAGPLLAGVFGGDVESLSVRAVMPAFVKMEREHGSLVKAVQSLAGQNEHSVFTSLRSGLGTLIDRMAAALPQEHIRVEEDVIAVTHRSEGWRIRTRNAEKIFDAVIVSTPVDVTRRLLRGIDERFDSLLAMDASSAIVVALAFLPEQARTLSIPHGFGYLVPQTDSVEESAQLLACTFVDQKFPHRAPEGGILLRGFFGGAAATSLMHESDEALSALTIERLSEVLGTLPAPRHTIVRRWPWSLPQYAVGHPARMAKLEALTGSFPGLYLAGNAYYGVGLPDMVRMGRDAARRAAQKTAPQG